MLEVERLERERVFGAVAREAPAVGQHEQGRCRPGRQLEEPTQEQIRRARRGRRCRRRRDRASRPLRRRGRLPRARVPCDGRRACPPDRGCRSARAPPSVDLDAGNSRHSRPSSRAPPLPFVLGSTRLASPGLRPCSTTSGEPLWVPHYFPSTAAPRPTRSLVMARAQEGAIGRALAPDSPPQISQSGTGSPSIESGPSAGSYETNRIWAAASRASASTRSVPTGRRARPAAPGCP